MKWTDSIPTEEGFYFIKIGDETRVVKVEDDPDTGLCVKLDFVYMSIMMFQDDQWSEKIPEPM